MKKLFWILFILLAFHQARADCSIGANSSTGTINSQIQTAANNGCSGPHSNYVQVTGFSTIPWNGSITIPCPTSAGVVLTGPITTYDQPGILNAWAQYPQAGFLNSTTGESYQVIQLAGCTNPVTIQYLEVNGNRPSSGGGSINIPPNNQNVTIWYNWLHGNQEITPTACGGGTFWCYGDTAASLILMVGSHGDNNNIGDLAQNITITHNRFGRDVAGNIGAGDCSNVMNFSGGVLPNGVWAGIDQTGSECSAFFMQTDTVNLTFSNNTIYQQEQGTKWVEGGNGQPPGCNTSIWGPCGGIYSLFFQVNDKMDNNDISYWHRIGTEDQQSSVNYNPRNGTCSLPGGNITNNCMEHLNNDMHDQYLPNFAGWQFSLANTGYHRDDNNVMISNTGDGTPGDFEQFGTLTTNNNNLDQGNDACFIQYGGGLSTIQVSNNIFQGPNGGGCNLAFGINNAHGGPNPVHVNNAQANTPNTFQSVAPSFSPNGGTYSGSVVVTLHDTGITSNNQGPQGNTGIWCTTDNTAPAPKNGTSIYYYDGYQLTISSAQGASITLKCVGMWGAQNQPAAYPANYGFTPSNTVQAVFTNGGGTPTVQPPTFTPSAPFTFSPPQIIQIAQNTSGAVSHCTIDGSTPTSSSPTATSFTLNTTTTVSCLSTLSGFNNSSIVTGLYTVGTPVVTLVNVLTSPGGYHFTVGDTVQELCTAVYSDGSSAPCATTGPNAIQSWNTSDPTVVSISGTGFATAIGVGQANVWAVAGGITGSIATLYVDSAISITSLAITTTGSVTSIGVAGTNQLFANCTYSNSSVNDCSGQITGYTSSNPAVASISGTGLVTGLAGGVTDIGAFIAGGTVTTTQLGVLTQDVPGGVTYGAPTNTAMNTQYIFTGTATAGYGVNSCSFYLPAGTQTSGAFWDCVLTKATSSTTQQATALCSGRYTTTGTSSPAAWITVNLSGCRTIAPSTGYWLGVTTNQPGPVPQGFNDCGGTCSGAAPTTVGVGTYAYYFVTVPTFGDYSNQSLTMAGQGNAQSSQYLTLSVAGNTTITSPPVSLTVLGGTGVTTLQGISVTGATVR